MRAGRHLDRRELPRLCRVADIDQRRAVRRLHVRDEGHAPVDDHLPPPGQSKYATCFTPLAPVALPLMSYPLPLAAETEVTESEGLALEARRVRRPQLLEDAQG